MSTVVSIRSTWITIPAIALLGCAKADQAPAPAPPPPAPAPVAPNVVTLTATDYAFQAPDTIPAGITTLRLVNQGKEIHHVVLMKVKPEMLKKMNPEAPPPPDLVVPGGTNGAAPGMTTEASLDLEPGDYTIVCLVPTAENVPHFLKGMVRPITVVPGTSTATLPTPDITVRLTDYAFSFSSPLTAGHHVLKIENAASQLHEMLIVKLNEGKTAKDMANWGLKPSGPPPGIPVASASPMSNGRSITVPVDLTPGNYALICFVPDAKDGKFHTFHGMVQDLKIS